MSIIASNPLDSATVSVVISVAESVVGVSVTDSGGVTSPGELKYFTVSFDALPSNAVVDVAFGDDESATFDGQHTEVTNPMRLSHVYVTSGAYTIEITAYNNVSRSTASLDFTVSATQDCKRPRVTIKDVYAPLFYRPYIVPRKDAFTLSAEANLDCGTTVKTNDTWSVDEVDTQFGHMLRGVDIESLASRTNFDFAIPARFLPYGLYRVTYSVVMDGPSDAFSDRVVTYIRVVKSPLIARLMQGVESTLVRGWGQDVTLDPGRFSLDPDLESGESQVSGITCPGGLIINS